MKMINLFVVSSIASIMLIATIFVEQSFADDSSVSSLTFKQGEEVSIWQGAAPGSEDWKIQESITTDAKGGRLIANVIQPTMTIFYPDPKKANGTAVIWCAGGGFRSLPDPKDPKTVQWMLDGGITVLVLKYRLMQGTPEELTYRQKLQSGNLTAEKINEDLAGAYMKSIRAIAAADGRQAVKFARSNAAKLSVAPDRIGIIGNSSGALLATTVGVEHDKDSRPDFIGVLWGAPPDAVTAVSEDAPPAFIVSSIGDSMTWDGSVRLYTQWRKANRAAELLIYGHGGHSGRDAKNPEKNSDSRAKADFLTWLKMEDLLK
jgi:acetyl esterase/lipase